MTISSQYEVKRYSEENDLPQCDLKHIALVEFNLFDNYLGLDFYDYILSKIVDYSDVEDWASMSYVVNSEVLYEGEVYVSTVSTSNEPVISEDWILAPKFSSDCLNKLYCDGYLKELIAYSVIKSNIPGFRAKITASGITYTKNEEVSRTIKSEVEARITQQTEFVMTLVKMVDRFIQSYTSEDKETCFSLYKKYAPKLCKIEEDNSDHFVG